MLSGQLVRLREYRRSDTARAQAFINDPEVARMINVGNPYPYNFESELSFVEGQSSISPTYNFAIEVLENGLYIGGCGAHNVNWRNRSAVVGIMVGDSAYWGRGYGTDAMQLLLRFLFEQMDMHRVSLQVFGYNQRAVRSYEKCGFVQEGVHRDAIYYDGRYHDEITMAILSTEYCAAKDG